MNFKRLNNLIKNLNIFVIFLIMFLGVLIVEKLCLVKYIIIILKLLIPLFIGIFIAWLLKPIINYLESKLNRISACILVYSFIIAIIYLIIKKITPIFIIEFDEFMNMFPKIINDLFSNIKIGLLSDIKNDLICGIDKFLDKLKEDIPSKCMSLISGISNLIIAIIISFYISISKYSINLKKYVKKITYNLILKIDNLLRGYVKATFLSSLIVFILSFLSFYILGLKNALLLGLICGITNIIPYIGPYLGALIPILISFTKSISFGIIVSVIIFIIQTIEGNIISPIIMSKNINLNLITTIVSLIIFGYFFGIVGMIIGVPIVAIIKELYLYYRKYYMR